MLFTSLHFLVFFPIVTVIYFVIPQKFKWLWLLIASFYFYMAWNPKYAIILATSIVITYIGGILISRVHKQPTPRTGLLKLIVALTFTINLGILFFFKYFDFFIDNLNRVLKKLGMELVQPQFSFLLPIGISFYTFQALGYIIDVYRKNIEAERHLGKYALFVSFFPLLVAGPIERAKNLLKQIHQTHSFNFERMKHGLLLMLWGFFQKLVIADRVAILVNNVYNNAFEYAGFEVAIATVLFAVQIYCDFCAYSDIARGAAAVMGFRATKNFDTPYFSTSTSEFWRRWHISLSTWFRDYLYFPLGGNRKGQLRTYLNLMIVFVVSGFWHGASWTFIIWGGLHGIYQVIGRATKPFREKLLEKAKIRRDNFSYRLGQILITFSLVCFAWIFFRANSLADAVVLIKNLFVYNPWVLFDDVSLYQLGLDRFDFRIAIISIVILIAVSILRNTTSLTVFLKKQLLAFQWAVYLVLIFMVLIFGIYGEGYSSAEFIYFQF